MMSTTKRRIENSPAIIVWKAKHYRRRFKLNHRVISSGRWSNAVHESSRSSRIGAIFHPAIDATGNGVRAQRTESQTLKPKFQPPLFPSSSVSHPITDARNRHALDTGGGAGVRIWGNPDLERFQRLPCGKYRLKRLWTMSRR